MIFLIGKNYTIRDKFKTPIGVFFCKIGMYVFFVAKIKISDKYFVFVTPSHRSHYHKHVYPFVQKQFIYSYLAASEKESLWLLFILCQDSSLIPFIIDCKKL
jgi:hypothetical protein